MLFIERSISLRIKPLNGLMNTQYRQKRLLLASSKQSTLVCVASRVVPSSCSDSEKFQAALAYPGLLKVRNSLTPNRCISPKASRRAGLPETTRFHDLRHTCATLLLRQGVNPKFVQELLGHTDVSLTLNIYSHVLPDMGGTAAGAMDDALG